MFFFTIHRLSLFSSRWVRHSLFMFVSSLHLPKPLTFHCWLFLNICLYSTWLWLREKDNKKEHISKRRRRWRQEKKHTRAEGWRREWRNSKIPMYLFASVLLVITFHVFFLISALLCVFFQPSSSSSVRHFFRGTITVSRVDQLGIWWSRSLVRPVSWRARGPSRRECDERQDGKIVCWIVHLMARYV